MYTNYTWGWRVVEVEKILIMHSYVETELLLLIQGVFQKSLYKNPQTEKKVNVVKCTNVTLILFNVTGANNYEFLIKLFRCNHWLKKRP